MKMVEAIIRRDKLELVLAGLSEIGYPGITVSEVKGHGKQKGMTQHWRGNEYTIQFIQKIKIEVVVLDEDLPRILDVVVRHSRTGNMGDGKVFVFDVEEAIRVRTGDSGFNAI
jgi:nitrogen regulatory protein P-II 1